jgi:hypothetical protein
LEFFLNVPIASKPTVVGTADGVITLVVVPEGRGVRVGVDLGVFEGVIVGEGGRPFESTTCSSAKPGAGVGVALLLPLPPQLSINAPVTNNRKGARTSHLSHRDNIIE